MTNNAFPPATALLPLAVAATLVLAVAAGGGGPAVQQLVAGPYVAVGVMGVAMIAAALSARLWVGMALALLGAVVLIQAARAQGLPPLPHPFSTGLALIVASASFAARGTLFARAYPARGWLIAVAVVGGEAALLATAQTMPGTLPGWLLALLPAQWAAFAVQTALTGTGTRAAASQLYALAGTGAVTLLVARLLPRRWPYALMFTAWVALSALVWLRPGPVPPPRAAPAALRPDGGSGRHAPVSLPAASGSAVHNGRKTG
jgi:hypothetical protein